MILLHLTAEGNLHPRGTDDIGLLFIGRHEIQFTWHYVIDIFPRDKQLIINPLSEHIDLRAYYLAFIGLEKFGLEKEIQDEWCTRWSYKKIY